MRSGIAMRRTEIATGRRPPELPVNDACCYDTRCGARVCAAFRRGPATVNNGGYRYETTTAQPLRRANGSRRRKPLAMWALCGSSCPKAHRQQRRLRWQQAKRTGAATCGDPSAGRTECG